MQVLVIGYGKIGRIKALLWKSLGASVYVHDVRQPTLQKAVNDGFKTVAGCLLDQDLTIDISSPAGQHFESLKWCMGTVSSPIRQILIEKPLASSLEELNKFNALNKSVKDKIILNESYFSSKGLLKLTDSIDSAPSRVEIELSKNRLVDVAKGRFFDQNLGAVGIETPHMLAILQMLNIPLDLISISDASLYVDSRQVENQGFEINFMSGSTSVVLRSFLGNFTSSGSCLIKSNRTIRNIKVRTETNDYVLEFDPASDLPRYHSRLTSSQLSQSKTTVTEFGDDHLREHMLQFQKNDSMNPLLKFDNAIYLSSVLSKLRSSFNVISISNATMETMPQSFSGKGLK